MAPRALIFSGYGLNCEAETRTAFEHAGGKADIMHINDLIAQPNLLKRYEILAMPGGFSYGDDTGSGKAYAHRLMHHLGEAMTTFLERDTLMIGICNGFQILTEAKILPGALLANDSGRFICRWVDLKVTGNSPWLTGIEQLSLPIAHREGKYYDNPAKLARLQKEGAVALTYVKGDICTDQSLPPNPNGALLDIAGITNHEGRVLGLMPHPERGSFFTQLPHWTKLREEHRRTGTPLPTYAEGIRLFENAVRYFS